MKLWKRWKNWKRSGRRVTVTEKEIRQVHRLSYAVVRIILADVGESVLRTTLEGMKKNREEKGESDYTSLAEIWLTAQERWRKLEERQ